MGFFLNSQAKLKCLQTSNQENLKRVDATYLEVKKLMLETSKVNELIEKAKLKQAEVEGSLH